MWKPESRWARKTVTTGIVGPVTASLVLVVCPQFLHAQDSGIGFAPTLSFLTEYPDHFQEGCGSTVAVAPSGMFHFRPAGFLTLETGIGAHVQIPQRASRPCGIALPPEDGQLRRMFDTKRGAISPVAEGQIVLTPLGRASWLRIVGGGAWYLTRSVPAWLFGVGYRSSTSKGGIVLDFERWNVGVPYDLERFRLGAANEFVSSGREWQRFWSLRLGLVVWVN